MTVGAVWSISYFVENTLRNKIEKLQTEKKALEDSLEWGSFVPVEDLLPPPPKKKDSFQELSPQEQAELDELNRVSKSPSKRIDPFQEFGGYETSNEKKYDEYGIAIKKSKQKDLLGILNTTSSVTKKFIPQSDTVEGVVEVKTKQNTLRDLVVEDTVTPVLKNKINEINQQVDKKLHINEVVQNLWIWVLILLSVLAYPVRVIVLLTGWSIRTLKS